MTWTRGFMVELLIPCHSWAGVLQTMIGARDCGVLNETDMRGPSCGDASASREAGDTSASREARVRRGAPRRPKTRDDPVPGKDSAPLTPPVPHVQPSSPTRIPLHDHEGSNTV